jgi:predicted exporter
MTRIVIILAVVAAVALGLWRGVVWLRADAKADILRELVAAQAERQIRDRDTKDRIGQEIENEDRDALCRRAVSLGMLPPDACR